MDSFPTPFAGLRAVILAVLTGLTALAPSASPAQSQPRLPTVQLQAGIHLIRAEVAASDQTRMRGLMFRESLGPSEGMLFVFESRARQCFWMRNTPLALSIAFIGDDGRIVNLEDMQPRTDDSHCSAAPVRFALEMEQGWFRRKGIGAGSKLAGPPGLFVSPKR